MRSFYLLTALMLAVPTVNGQVAYYLERHGVVTPAQGNPEREQPDEWRIRLYRPGTPKSGPGWGQIIAQSAEDAREELQRSREFQERLGKFCNGASPNEDSPGAYSNDLGPIAVYREAKLTEGKTRQLEKKNEAELPQNESFDMADRIGELEKEFLAATEEKRVQQNPSRYPFAPASAPWMFAAKLAETKRAFEESNAWHPSSSTSSHQISDTRMRIKDALTELETNLLPPMRKALANVTLEGKWKHRGITYVSVREGEQLSLRAETPDGLRFRNITIGGDTTLNGEIEFVYDNGCEAVWAHFTAELTFDTNAEGILISVPRVGREKTTCRQVTQGTLRMMFWRPEP